MTICVIAQPIHPIGIEILLAAGIEVMQVVGTSLEALEKVIPSADALIVRDRLPAYCMDLAPRLTVIANHGTGTDKVDVDYATSLGIPVVFTPTANVRSVAEHALMLMLATGRHAVLADTAARQGNWAFKYEQPMQSLYGKTLGVVGLGHTGRLVCEMASVGLGMKVIVWSPSLPTDTYLPVGVERASCLKDLLQISDVVSLHRPLRQDTFHMLNRETLQQMKRGAIVINTSRGALIDEVALVEALRSGHLFGAGLDVFEQEPLLPDSLLSGIQNVILTPHIAGSSQDALKATASQCAQQIVRVLSGDLPENLVQPGVWENRRRPVCIS